MESEGTPELLRMARIVGLPAKGAYTLREVARASGASYTTLYEDAVAGRLRTFLPPGRTRGRLVKPEWFEDWWKEGMENAG
ncbi:DNA-binding protein [Eggerthella lenta]|uniref:DNA-binding protein n=1 Tax=Eggerthella lenta TaxID=84112 RepID=A0A5C5BRF6_EGGLN|nr:DNA-binding protein [Eggerthella lenta]TNU89008.1 DNA-binding protein [Eggerthella lenta]